MLKGRGDDDGKRGERGEQDKIELACPQCGDKVVVTASEAEKGRVRCKRGHEFEVMGLLGGPT